MRFAPPGLIGTQVGIRNFLAGLLALAGGLGVGFAFDSGRSAALDAMLGLTLLSAVAAAASARWLAKFGRRSERPIRIRYQSGGVAQSHSYAVSAPPPPVESR
jgi:hypothetical protein